MHNFWQETGLINNNQFDFLNRLQNSRFFFSPQSRSMFSTLFETFCLTARAYLNTQKYGLFCPVYFLKGRSTLTQLLLSLRDWAKSRNLSRPTDEVFLDLAKHSTVFRTSGSCWSWKVMVLTAACMPGSGTSWQDLAGQRVILRGTRSNWSSVTSGCPEGTILGPQKNYFKATAKWN